jgi:hypothetical protein
MSDGEKMVWAAAYVAFLKDNTAQHAVVEAIIAAGEAVYELRTSWHLVGFEHDDEAHRSLPRELREEFTDDIRFSYDQILGDSRGDREVPAHKPKRAAAVKGSPPRKNATRKASR